MYHRAKCHFLFGQCMLKSFEVLWAKYHSWFDSFCWWSVVCCAHCLFPTKCVVSFEQSVWCRALSKVWQSVPSSVSSTLMLLDGWVGGVGGAVPLVSHRLGPDDHQHDVAADKNVHTGDVCILNLSSTEKSGLDLAGFFPTPTMCCCRNWRLTSPLHRVSLRLPQVLS